MVDPPYSTAHELNGLVHELNGFLCRLVSERKHFISGREGDDRLYGDAGNDSISGG
jgi:hypothetical protein